MLTKMHSPKISTPRPTPMFFEPPLTFSTKKERGSTPKDSAPPRPPIKSAPPISRIFPRKQVLPRCQPVSFKSPDKSILNPCYNESKKELYFDQCFEIECRIGSGSFGEVFKVRSKEDGCLYAIKRSRQRFKGETDRHRRLEEVDKHETLPAHPNCVRFIKAWEERKHLYIQTELCKTSLSAHAEEHHNIPERLIWNYLVDLLMAVKHLHDHDLVHMDVKPDNVFISDDNVCKLGDFGLVLDLTKDEEIVNAQEGDPKYLAPELMMGQFGKPADVFSVGITILELASDLDLPRGNDLWHQLRSGQLPEDFLAGKSKALRETIRWMMEPNPKNRPTVDQVLAHKHVEKIWKERVSENLQNSLVIKPSPPPVQQRTPSKREIMKHPPEWDQSFSDDEYLLEHGCTSIHNNSLGVPLDTSSSGEESLQNNNFVIPNLLPRKALTTPGYRRRPLGTSQSISSGSPTFSPNGSFRSSSPISGATKLSMSAGSKVRKVVVTDSSDGEDPQTLNEIKMSVEPKNLMKAFETTAATEEGEIPEDIIPEKLRLSF